MKMSEAHKVLELLISDKQQLEGYLFRLDRSTVEDDLWWVIPPPKGVQVNLFRKVNGSYREFEFLKSDIFDEQMTCSDWETNEFAWRYDLKWLETKYQEILKLKERCNEFLQPMITILGVKIESEEVQSFQDSFLRLVSSNNFKDEDLALLIYNNFY